MGVFMFLELSRRQFANRIKILFGIFFVLSTAYFGPTWIQGTVNKEKLVHCSPDSTEDIPVEEKDYYKRLGAEAEKYRVTECDQKGEEKWDRRRFKEATLILKAPILAHQTLLIYDRVRDLSKAQLSDAREAKFWSRIVNISTIMSAVFYGLFFASGIPASKSDDQNPLSWLLNVIPKPLIIVGIILAVPPTLGFHTKYAASSQAFIELRGLKHQIESDIAVLAYRVINAPEAEKTIKTVEERAFHWSDELAEIEATFGKSYSKNSPLLNLPKLSGE